VNSPAGATPWFPSREGRAEPLPSGEMPPDRGASAARRELPAGWYTARGDNPGINKKLTE
jgi:hypothetical protein